MLFVLLLTYLLSVLGDTNAVYTKYQLRGMFEKEKNAMYELFKNIKVKQIKKNHGLYFKVGTNDALIHSEPNIVEQRVFISILTGTVEQINEYKLKRMNF